MPEFNGFPKETIKFFNNLERNNSREWFFGHKDVYENFVKMPAFYFISEMEPKLKSLSPGFFAVPRIDESLFRLNRDVRFSNDKRPYKTNLGIWFWEGYRKRMECSGFYFQIETGKLMLAAGAYMFTKETIKLYRDALVDKKLGPAFKMAAEAVIKKGYNIGGEFYKKVPAGYDKNHKNVPYLLYNGLYAFTEVKIPQEFFSSKLADFAFNHYKNMYPLHKWLVDAIG